MVYLHLEKGRSRPRGIRVPMRIRKVMDRVHAEAKKCHGLHRARYRGRLEVAFQAVMTFLAMNTKRIANWNRAGLALQTR